MRKLFNLFWISVFIIGSVIPLFHMNTAEITEQENRTLEKFPEMKKGKEFNLNYGKEFESWLGDRFGGRGAIIFLNVSIHYLLNEHYQANNTVKGKNDWMFSIRKDNSVNLSKDGIASLKKLKELCDKNKIKLFVIIPPHSVDIYTEYYPLPYNGQINKATSDFLMDKNSFVTLLGENFKKAKDKKLFFKKDPHWTDEGALIAYKKFIQEFKKVYPNALDYNSKDFKILSIPQENYMRDGVSINGFCKSLGVNYSIFCHSDFYPYYIYKGEIEEEKVGAWKWGAKKFLNKNGYPLKIMLLGKSYTSSFNVFLSAYFREVIRLDMNSLYSNKVPSIKPYWNFIQMEKPDVLILLLHAGQISINLI